MTPIDNDLGDFRSHAVAESEALQRILPTGVSMEKSGISYCLVRQPCFTRLRAPIKVTAVACGVLGLSGVAAALIIGLSKSDMLAGNVSLLAMTICCFFGGILFLLVPTYVERWIVHHHLSQHDDDYETESGAKGIHICLEYAPTYSSIKLLAEDVGLIYFYPEDHYVKIDGLSYEYVVRSNNVVDLSLHSDCKSVLLSYRVGEELLELAIAPRGVLPELMRQTVGSSRSLFLKMQAALKPNEGTD
jgi:hypothetical protein